MKKPVRLMGHNQNKQYLHYGNFTTREREKDRVYLKQ